jgi:hypothetical protein
LRDTYPIFLRRVAPAFIGKDARDLEDLLWDVYRRDSNYKHARTGSCAAHRDRVSG